MQANILAYEERSLHAAVLGDGRGLLLFTGLALALSSGFALFLSADGYFLPPNGKAAIIYR